MAANVNTVTPLEMIVGTYASSAPPDISATAGSLGDSSGADYNRVARGNHTHKITVTTGTANG